MEELVSHRLLDGGVLLVDATATHVAYQLTEVVNPVIVHMVLPLLRVPIHTLSLLSRSLEVLSLLT